MAIDRTKNKSDAALVGSLKELVAAERGHAERLRALVAVMRERNLPLPRSVELALEDLEEDERAPLDGVTRLPDGAYQVVVLISDAAYGHLLELGTLIDRTTVAHDAAVIIEAALAQAVEIYRA